MRNVIRCGNLLSWEYLRFLPGGEKKSAVTRSGHRDVNLSL